MDDMSVSGGGIKSVFVSHALRTCLLTDDSARSSEVRDHRLGHEQWCSHVDIEDFCVVCCGSFCDSPGKENTCIVDQNVDLVSKSLGSCLNYLFRCAFSRKVRLDDRGIAAVVE
jgi:hypothetical protein